MQSVQEKQGCSTATGHRRRVPWKKSLPYSNIETLMDFFSCATPRQAGEQNQRIPPGTKSCRISPTRLRCSDPWLHKTPPWQSKVFVSSLLSSVCERCRKRRRTRRLHKRRFSPSLKSIVLGSSTARGHMEALCHKRLYHATVNCRTIHDVTGHSIWARLLLQSACCVTREQQRGSQVFPPTSPNKQCF